jgi:hypothetical protein
MTAQPNLEPRGWNGGPMKYGASMGRPSCGLTDRFTADDARERATELRSLAAVLLDCLHHREPHDTRTDSEIRNAIQDRLADAYRLETMADTGKLASLKVSLRRIRINQGGYDDGGSYWGLGDPLYWAGSDCGTVDLWFRSDDRASAKDHVRSQFPNARFYR